MNIEKVFNIELDDQTHCDKEAAAIVMKQLKYRGMNIKHYANEKGRTWGRIDQTVLVSDPGEYIQNVHGEMILIKSHDPVTKTRRIEYTKDQITVSTL